MSNVTSTIETFSSNRSSKRSIVEALRTTPLLRDLPDTVMDKLAAISQIVEVPEDTEVCRQGDNADELFIVLEGQLAGSSSAANGSTAVVEVIRSGETLGLATVLARLPRLIGVRTVTASTLLTIGSQALLDLVEQEPSLVTALLRAEANEFRALVRQVCDLKLRTTAQRLGCYLLSLTATGAANSAAAALRQATARRSAWLPAGKFVPRIRGVAWFWGGDTWRAGYPA
jgi:CRP-like cAMP-binding protein